jgi:hypothetical protein
MPIAITISVTDAATGNPISDAVLTVSGQTFSSGACGGGTCFVPGTAGTYTLEVRAAGFETARRTVTVRGTTPDCDCPTVTPEHVAIALVAAP